MKEIITNLDEITLNVATIICIAEEKGFDRDLISTLFEVAIDKGFIKAAIWMEKDRLEQEVEDEADTIKGIVRLCLTGK